MRKVVFLLILYASGSLFAQSLKIVHGNSLCYQNGKAFIEVKEVENSADFRGYDIIDSEHIFIAYQPENSAEASTIIAIYNIQNQEETVIADLGGTGESFFHYHVANGSVVFNGGDGIYLFKLRDASGRFIRKIETKRLIEGDNFILPFWVDTFTIGYQVWEDEKWVLKFLEIN